MTEKDPMPFGNYKSQPISAVPKEYRDWLCKQDGFKDKNPELYSLFTGIKPTNNEVELDAAEDVLLETAPPGFADWWWKQYGKNLRRTNSELYIPHMRVAIAAWQGALGYSAISKVVPPPVKLMQPAKSTKDDDMPF